VFTTVSLSVFIDARKHAHGTRVTAFYARMSLRG